MENEKSVFETLKAIDVSKFVEKKNKLDYLSWAHAWSFVKSAYPLANYKVYENDKGMNYHTDGMTGWVKCSVTINDLEHIEYLPIMNNINKSIKLSEINSFDVNKSIQRCLTKAIARHGLGLNVYAGEDLPDDTKQEQKKDELTPEKKELILEVVKLRADLETKGHEFTEEQMDYLDKIESGVKSLSDIKTALSKLKNIGNENGRN